MLGGSQSNTSARNPSHHVARRWCQDDNLYRLRCCAWHDSPSWLWSGETSADALLVAPASMREGQFKVVRCGTKENPSDLGTKVLEREAMASCMSKLAIVPASTLRGAIVAALTRVPSASDEVIVDECCSI